MQECFWRGLVSDQDQDKKLGERVFAVLVKTLGSARHLSSSGLAIQLAAILPRLSDQYEKDGEHCDAAKQAAKTIQEWCQQNASNINNERQV